MATEKHVKLAVMFADITGSGRLLERFGEEKGQALIGACVGAMESITKRCSGTVVKTIGDEIMAVFDSADAAFDAAVGIQRGHDDGPVAVHIGFNYGTVLQKDDDYFGDVVNVAKRVVDRATGDEIMTTGSAMKELSSERASKTRHVDNSTMKNRAKAVKIYEITWRADEEHDLTIIGTLPPSSPDGLQSAVLKLEYGGRVFSLDAANETLTMGRDALNDLVMESRSASRRHAKIELIGDKFTITDQSANGTYIVNKSGDSLVLKRGNRELVGSGYCQRRRKKGPCGGVIRGHSQ